MRNVSLRPKRERAGRAASQTKAVGEPAASATPRSARRFRAVRRSAQRASRTRA